MLRLCKNANLRSRIQRKKSREVVFSRWGLQIPRQRWISHALRANKKTSKNVAVGRIRLHNTRSCLLQKVEARQAATGNIDQPSRLVEDMRFQTDSRIHIWNALIVQANIPFRPCERVLKLAKRKSVWRVNSFKLRKLFGSSSTSLFPWKNLFGKRPQITGTVRLYFL